MHTFSCLRWALLLSTLASVAACSTHAELGRDVTPKVAATAQHVASGDPVAYPADSTAAKSSAQVNGICAYANPTQNGTRTFSRVYYVRGQKMRVTNGMILATGCNTPSSCDVWLVRGGTYVATLVTGHNPNYTGSTFDVDLPTNINTGNDYGIVFHFSNGSNSGVYNPITIYLEKPKLFTVNPSNLTYQNSSTVQASWAGWVWAAGTPIDVYVYGFGPQLADNTRTKVGSVLSPGAGTATLSFPAPPSGGNFSANRQWMVRVQEANNDLSGNLSLAKNTTN